MVLPTPSAYGTNTTRVSGGTGVCRRGRLLVRALRLAEDGLDLGELVEFGTVASQEDRVHALLKFPLALMVLCITGVYHLDLDALACTDG
jgi:hypothetical protein